MLILAYVFGCLAAVADASTNVMQRAASRAESPKLEFSFQLIRNLMRRKLWRAGVATMPGSFLFQSLGLGFGTLSVIWGAFVFHEAMRGGYWVIAASVAAMTGGSIVLARSPGLAGDRAASEEGATQPEPRREAA